MNWPEKYQKYYQQRIKIILYVVLKENWNKKISQPIKDFDCFLTKIELDENEIKKAAKQNSDLEKHNAVLQWNNIQNEFLTFDDNNNNNIYEEDEPILNYQLFDENIYENIQNFPIKTHYQYSLKSKWKFIFLFLFEEECRENGKNVEDIKIWLKHTPISQVFTQDYEFEKVVKLLKKETKTKLIFVSNQDKKKLEKLFKDDTITKRVYQYSYNWLTKCIKNGYFDLHFEPKSNILKLNNKKTIKTNYKYELKKTKNISKSNINIKGTQVLKKKKKVLKKKKRKRSDIETKLTTEFETKSKKRKLNEKKLSTN